MPSIRAWSGKTSSSHAITATARNSSPLLRCIVPTATRSRRVLHPVRRQALDRERPSHPDLPVVRVRLVVEVLELRLGRDGGVDLLLSRDARLPPVGVDGARSVRPLRVRLAEDLPLLPLPTSLGDGARRSHSPRPAAPPAIPAS